MLFINKNRQMKYLLIITAFTSLTACNSMKQSTKTQVNDFTVLKKMVNEKNFDFVAERMNPAKGLPRNLTGFYDLKVSDDSLNVQLPYIGQSSFPPIDPSQSPMNFINTSFEYSFTESNDKLNVIIKPTGNTKVQQFLFEIFSNGNATLSVNSSDKQSISYQGYIAANP